jgi:hypothetical protein
MKRSLLLILLCLISTLVHAGQSVIVDSEGYACMGDDKSRKATEQAAVTDARRKGGDAALTYIQAETKIKDAMMEKDLINAYTNAQVKLVAELLKEWFKDAVSGDCYRVKLKLEVTPDEKAMTDLTRKKGDELLEDPAAPLTVKVWTNKEQYRDGEKIKVYLKGNRPFYGKVVYRDASGALAQILPNPFRKDVYFNGGTVYELPAGDDQYDLEVSAPFGVEQLTLYASTAPLGDLEVESAGTVYRVRSLEKNIPVSTRALKVVAKHGGSGIAAAEFAEAVVSMTTRKQ